MHHSRPTLRGLSDFTFRVSTSLAAAFFVVWITFVGILAVLANPYFFVVYWFLGFAGLFACCGALINSCPLPSEPRKACHPVRAAGCVLAAGAIGWLFWAQAKPALASRTESLEFLGAFLALAMGLGLVAMVFLSLLLLLARAEEGRSSGQKTVASS